MAGRLMRRSLVVAAGLSLTVTGSAVAALRLQPPEPPPPVVGHLFEPQVLDYDPAVARRLEVPRGYQVQEFAADVGNPRMIAVADDGTVYVTRRETGDVLALIDRDGNGHADRRRVVADGLEFVNGIHLHEGRMYLATDTQVHVATVQGPGRLGPLSVLVDDLPDAGQHPNRTLAFGPDGMLYVTVGSTCNSCPESNPESATMLRFRADGSGREIFASGLRNTIGFGWHPRTGELFGMDHGADWRGDDQPPEELNRLQQGRNYGWPWCFGDRRVDPYIPGQPEGSTKQAFCAQSTSPALTYQAHSAPLGMVFVPASFDRRYDGDALVAMRGSWNRKEAVGYKVVRVDFRDGRPVAFDDFLTGLLTRNGTATYGRPVGLAFTSDGALLVGDDTNGVVYRVSRARGWSPWEG